MLHGIVPSKLTMPGLRGRDGLVLGISMLAALFLGSGTLHAEEAPLAALSLGQAVEFALAHHPRLRAQASAEEASHEQAGVARTSYLPQVGLSLQANFGTGNVLRGPLFSLSNIPAVSGPPTGRSLADASFGTLIGGGASWDVLSLVGGMAQVDAALAAQAQAHAAMEVRRLEVAYEAADQFLDLLARQEAVRAARASVERARVFATIVKARVEQSLRPGADASRADAELAVAANLLVRAEQAESMSRAALARALGVADRDVKIVAGRLHELPPAEPRQPPTPHPLIAEATAAVQAAQARRHAAAVQYLPRLDVLAALWTRGSGLSSGALEPSGGAGFVPDTPNFVAGLVLTWQPLDLIRARARTRVESALVQQASAARDDVTQAIVTQVRQARDTLVAARRVARNTAAELVAVRAAEAQAAARYRAGLASIVEVAEAQRLLTQAESDDAVERVNIWRALLLISRAIGDLSPFLAAADQGGP